MNNKALFLILFLSFFVLSCSKNDDDSTQKKHVLKEASNSHKIELHSNNRVASLKMSTSEYKSWKQNNEFGSSEASKALFQDIYKKFEDDYDFIFLILNETEIPEGLPAGRLLNIKNDIAGIGLSIYDNTNKYGSKGRLNAIMELSKLNYLTQGPALHELMHNWGNYALQTTNNAHWGFTGGSGKGQLGGFEQSTLIENGNNSYTVNSFGEVANGGNSVKYNELELYLMGMIPLSSVKPFDNFSEISNKSFSEGKYTFNSSSRKTFDSTSIENLLGKREPSYENSQKDFNLLLIVLTDKDLSDEEWAIVDDQAAEFGKKGEGSNPEPYTIDGVTYQPRKTYNFWEATNGKGTLTIGDF